MHHATEFVGPKKERSIIHYMHDAPSLFGRNAFEGRFANLPGVFQLPEKGLQGLEVVHHGGVLAALAGRVPAVARRIQLRELGHVKVLVVNELPILQQQLRRHLPGAEPAQALDGQESLEFTGLALEDLESADSHDAVSVCLLQIAQKALIHRLLLFSFIQAEVFRHHPSNLQLEDAAVHVHPLDLHEGVCKLPPKSEQFCHRKLNS